MPTVRPSTSTVDLTASDATLTDSGGDPVTSLSFSVGDQSSEEFDFTRSSDDARPVITLTPQQTFPSITTVMKWWMVVSCRPRMSNPRRTRRR